MAPMGRNGTGNFLMRSPALFLEVNMHVLTDTDLGDSWLFQFIGDGE